MSELNGLEKFAKRWQVILGAAFAICGMVAGVVTWKNSLAKADAVENVRQRLTVAEKQIDDEQQRQRDHQRQHELDRAQHDAELRWISDHLIRIEGKLDAIRKGR